jgi:cobalt-zinc-cadmium efflux system membrane fusion protein
MSKQVSIRWFVCVAALSFWGVAGCGKESAAERNEGEKEQERAVGSLTVEQVMQDQCPHGLTIECAECRYEVGVVKLDPQLVKATEGSRTGLVQIARVTRRHMSTAIHVTGEIRGNANAAVHVNPRIPGVIRAVNVDIGSEVKKGDILFAIESVELGQAISEHERNTTLETLSAKTFHREKSLYEQKIGSESEMIEAQMRFEEYQTARKASEQRLHALGVSESEIAAVIHTNHNTVSGTLAVRAPMDGTVIEKHAVVGELTDPSKDVMSVTDLTRVWMWAGVYERDLALLLTNRPPEGLPVEIIVPAYPGAIFRGQMDHVGAGIDASTRTVPVRTILDNRDRRLLPGMFCEGRILVRTGEEVLAVPRTALLSDEGTDFVFTHMKDDYYLRVNVTKGREFAEGVEILTGLAPGQTIVSQGAFILKSDILRSKMGAGCAD